LKEAARVLKAFEVLLMYMELKEFKVREKLAKKKGASAAVDRLYGKFEEYRASLHS